MNLRKDLQFVFYIRTTDHYWRGIIFFTIKLNYKLFDIMDNRNDYFDYSHLDAPDVLQQVLSYYFTNAIKVKNYALPKRHFDEILRSNTYVDARWYFRIITDTNLVTKKIISSYKTDNGVRYLVQKEYYQQIQRMQRVK